MISNRMIMKLNLRPMCRGMKRSQSAGPNQRRRRIEKRSDSVYIRSNQVGSKTKKKILTNYCVKVSKESKHLKGHLAPRVCNVTLFNYALRGTM